MYGAWTQYNAEQHKKTCSVCGDVQTEPHDWNEGIVTTSPTETADGVKTYTCEVCGETKTESIPYPGPGIIPVTGITLDKTAITLGADDSKIIQGSVMPSNATNRKIIWTNSNDSVVEMNRSVSGIRVDVIALKVGTAIITATTEDGGFVAQCVVTVEFDESEPHKHSYTPTVTPPTCINSGYTTYECSCGASYIDQYVSATDHVESEWIVEVFPTEDSEGKYYKECTICGEKLATKIVDALGGGQNGTTVTIPTISCSNSLFGIAGVCSLGIGASVLYFVKKREE